MDLCLHLSHSRLRMQTLIALSLCHNQTGDSGVQYFTDALRHNKVILFLTIFIISLVYNF